MIDWKMLYGRHSIIECPQCGSRLTYRKESAFTRDYTAMACVCLRCGKNMPVIHEKGKGKELDAAIKSFRDGYDRLLKDNLRLVRHVYRLKRELKALNSPWGEGGPRGDRPARRDPCEMYFISNHPNRRS